MDAIALDNASPMRPAPGVVCEVGRNEPPLNLLDNARWLLSSIPTAATLFGPADDKHSGVADAQESEEPSDLLALPAAATPRREGQDPRVATRHFPSPWLREQQQEHAASPAALGGALSRAVARAKSPVAQQRARSVLQNITNGSPAKSSPAKRAAASSTKRTPLKSSRSSAAPRDEAKRSAQQAVLQNVTNGSPAKSSPAKRAAANSTERTPLKSPRSSAAPPDETERTTQQSDRNLEKQAKLEALKVELKLLQVFAEKKAAAIRDGDPDSVHVSFASMQTRSEGADQWSNAEPTVVIVEVQPADAGEDSSMASTSSQVPSSPNRSPGVLKPSSPRAQPIELENAKKEEELARLKVELALLTQRKAATSRQKRVMEANHLWFGEQSSDAPAQQQEQQQEQQEEQHPPPKAVWGASTGPVSAKTVEDVTELDLGNLQERSAQRAAELDAARAELAMLNAQLRLSGKVRHGTGTLQLGEMMDVASESSGTGTIRPSPHSRCETVLVSS